MGGEGVKVEEEEEDGTANSQDDGFKPFPEGRTDVRRRTLVDG